MKSSMIAVIGGGRTQALLASLLVQDGHECLRVEGPAGLADLARAELAVLPLPAVREDGCAADGVTAAELFSRLRPGSVVTGGRIPPELFAMAEARGVLIIDYAARGDFAASNAVATAEGALGVAISHTEDTLQGAECLVVGNGRIGRLLAKKLALLGARVTVSARRAEDLACVAADGHRAVRTSELGRYAGEFDVIFNTVPARVLGEEVLRRTKPSVLTIDLASKPGGVDFSAAQALGRRTVWALGLPGKTAPLAAARSVRDTLTHIMEERPCSAIHA